MQVRRDQLTHSVLKDKVHYLKVVARLFGIGVFISYKTHLQFLKQFSIILFIIKSYLNSRYKISLKNVFTLNSQIYKTFWTLRIIVDSMCL